MTEARLLLLRKALIAIGVWLLVVSLVDTNDLVRAALAVVLGLGLLVEGMKAEDA